MGYNSNVVIYIVGTEEVLKKLNIEKLEDLKPIMDEAYVDEFTVGRNKSGENVLRAKWSWIKWYEDSYDEIIAVMNILNKLDADTEYTYSRLGEEFGDFETTGDLYEVWATASLDEDWVDFYNVDGLKPRTHNINCGNMKANIQLECREHMSILKEFHDNKTVITLTRDQDDYDKAVQNIQHINAYNSVNDTKEKGYKLDQILYTIQNRMKAKDTRTNVEYHATTVELEDYGNDKK